MRNDLCNVISPIEISPIICCAKQHNDLCNVNSPIENSPFQNWSSSTFSTSGFSRLFLIRILFFNLEKFPNMKILKETEKVQPTDNHATFLYGVFLVWIKLWFYLLGGGNAWPGSSGKSGSGSWNTIPSYNKIQFLETLKYNSSKNQNKISGNTEIQFLSNIKRKCS